MTAIKYVEHLESADLIPDHPAPRTTLLIMLRSAFLAGKSEAIYPPPV